MTTSGLPTRKANDQTLISYETDNQKLKDKNKQLEIETVNLFIQRETEIEVNKLLGGNGEYTGQPEGGIGEYTGQPEPNQLLTQNILDTFHTGGEFHTDSLEASLDGDSMLRDDDSQSITSCESDDSEASSGRSMDSNTGCESPEPVVIQDDEHKDWLIAAAINARSLTGKFDHMKSLADFMDVNILIIGETWEKEEKHGDEIVEFCQDLNFEWISQPRDPDDTGGGVALAISKSIGQTTRIDVPNPDNLEVIWTVTTPHTRPNLRLIVCAFYISPTSNRKPNTKDDLQVHVVEGIEYCNTRFKNTMYIIGGDQNNGVVEMDDVLAYPGITQRNFEPTRGPNILDFIYSDMNEVAPTVTLPPLTSDDERRSDHKIPIISVKMPDPFKKYITVKRRRVTENGKAEFLESMMEENWEVLSKTCAHTAAVQLKEMVGEKYDRFFPLVTRRVRVGGALWYNQKHRRLKRKANRLFKRHGQQSRKFKQARKKYRTACRTSKKKFLNNALDDALANNEPRKLHQIYKNLSTTDSRTSNITPTPAELIGMSDLEKANAAADRIEALTADFTPVEKERFQNTYWTAGRGWSEEDVLKAIKAMHIPRGKHDDDPPERVFKELAVAFVRPLTLVMNVISSTATWPDIWKCEVTTLIPKKKHVNSLSDLRPITMTEVFNKCAESMYRPIILEDIEQTLDLDQFGGRKKVGPSHLTCCLIEDVSRAADQDLASILFSFDYSSAFNCISHNEVIESAVRLGVRNEVVCILASYLENRSTVIKWGNERSSPRPALGGTGQGTLLAVVLFQIFIDTLLRELKVALDREERDLPEYMKSHAMAYIDDTCLVMHFDRKKMVENADGTVTLNDERIAKALDVIEKFSTRCNMRLNPSKSTALVFTHRGKKLKIPQGYLSFPSSGQEINEVETARVLGIQIDSKLNLHEYVNTRLRSAMNAAWILRRLKKGGVSQPHLIKAYLTHVRGVLEFGVVGLAKTLTPDQKKKLERVQRVCSRIITGTSPREIMDNYWPYETRLEHLGLQHLTTYEKTRGIKIPGRWENQFVKFAQKTEHDPRFARYYENRYSNPTQTLRFRAPYEVPVPNTERMKRSPLFQARKVLNERRPVV